MFRWPAKRPLVIAHRGARSLAPEETLAAARKALALGADMWEFDVHTLKDGTLVLCHDATLERTTDVKARYPDRAAWRLADFTWEEVRTLDAGSWFVDADPFGTVREGEVTPEEQASYVGEPLVSLADALSFVRDHHWRAMVEIKDESGLPGDRDIVERVVDAVLEAGLADSVVLASFNPLYVRRARERCADVTTMLLSDRPLSGPVSVLGELGATVFGPRQDALKADQVLPLHEAGYRVFVWTVNDWTAMRMLVDLGVDGIITDYPQRLLALLKGLRRPHTTPPPSEQGGRGSTG